MTKNKQKLELTWIGKGQEMNLEPRILVENPEKSYGDPDTENMLIHGDNLLALKALEQNYTGKIKCIYIDPPYNTGSAFEHYDDNVEHSKWLSLMKVRLEILKKLLTSDGVIAVQIDKNEFAYLKVLMDEIFGRDSYITTIAVRMSGTSGFKIEHADKTIVKNTEYIHIYSANINLKAVYEATDYDSHYSYILKDNGTGKQYISQLVEEDLVKKELEKYKLAKSSKSLPKLFLLSSEFKNFVNNNKEKIGRTHTAPAAALEKLDYFNKILNSEKEVVDFITDSGEKYYIKKTNNSLNQYIPIALKFQMVDSYQGYDMQLSNILGDWWDGFYLDMGNVENEGNVYFKASKKPERLLFRIFNMFTQENDYILDSFLGSGTTAAVAHKMGRKWIGIELGDHCYTHCEPRLKSVVDGIDSTGITKFVNWQGGGGYKFYELAPSLLKKDEFGNWIIDSRYDAEMLAEAMAKQEGYQFSPDEENIYKQGYSTEKDFIFTTTQFLSIELLDKIYSKLKEDESLLICATHFEEGTGGRYDNITVKKIPQMLLNRCEFGKLEYNLNIIDPPQETEDDEETLEEEE